MLVIDGHNIKNGGGITLLNYLIQELDKRNTAYRLIKYADVDILGDNHKQVNCTHSLFRKNILDQVIREWRPDCLLCFGNYPPHRRYGIKTITYFHNPYLVNSWFHHLRNDKWLLLRQLYVKRHLHNTDFMVFQNDEIKDQFITKYGGNRSQIIYVSIPFYDKEGIVTINNGQSAKKRQFCYISLPHPHKNHFFLAQVWSELLARNCKPKLVLTIPDIRGNKQLLRQFDLINAKGGNIVNLGTLSFQEAIVHTAQSEFCIYPSLLETFGMGLIEAALVGTKVVAADLPYIRHIITPSLTFDPFDVNSGVEAVLYSLSHSDDIPKTHPLIENQIDTFIRLLEQS